MRHWFFVVIVLIIAVAGGLYWALHSPAFTVKIARRVIEKSAPGLRVTELSLARQHLTWPGTFRWERVRLGVEFKGRTYAVDAAEFLVTGAQTALQAKKIFAVSIKGADVNFAPGQARNVAADIVIGIEGQGPATLSGPVTVASASWDKAKAADIFFHVAGNIREFELKDLRFGAYGGTLAGSVIVVVDGPAYTADITAENIETAKLAELNEQLASEIVGRTSGHVRLAGRGDQLAALESEWSMLDGAKVDAALLSALSQYIPSSRESKRLTELIKKGGHLPVEVLSFKVRSVSPRQLSGEIKLKSREVNLELNITPDINTDGTLTSLIEYWQTYFK